MTTRSIFVRAQVVGPSRVPAPLSGDIVHKRDWAQSLGLLGPQDWEGPAPTGALWSLGVAEAGVATCIWSIGEAEAGR